MKYLLIAISGILLTTGCQKPVVNLSPGDQQIINTAYTTNYVYPEGFYHEIIDTGSVYYENTLSITPVNQRQDIWIELSTNDRDQARTWSDLSNQYGSVNRAVVEEKETAKYFEFKRKNVLSASDIVLSRVHKTSYFKPLNNRFFELDTIGIYNGDLNTPAIKELVEYLWSSGTIGIDYTKVLESSITEFIDHWEQYIKSIKIITGDSGVPDEIYVYDNYFILNDSDKVLTVSSSQTDKIQGHSN
jgi:hypothetical protein